VAPLNLVLSHSTGAGYPVKKEGLQLGLGGGTPQQSLLLEKTRTAPADFLDLPAHQSVASPATIPIKAKP
jgi:hypothetical protein